MAGLPFLRHAKIASHGARRVSRSRAFHNTSLLPIVSIQHIQTVKYSYGHAICIIDQHSYTSSTSAEHEAHS